jgi:hypothetical protein
MDRKGIRISHNMLFKKGQDEGVKPVQSPMTNFNPTVG